MATYRKPTEKESEKLNMSRKKMIEGIMGEKDIFSRMMPTMAKSARDDIRAAKAMRESVPAMAREGEAYQDAGYKKGGKVKKFEGGGDVYDNYEKRSRINDVIRKEGLAPYEIKELEMKRPKDKIDKTIKPIGSSIGKGPRDSFNYEKAEKALADYRARMGSDAGGKTISSGSGGGGGIPKLNRDLTKNMKTGGKVSSASKRADGCAIRGKTRA
jgi:hypothetical protein